MNLLIKSLPLKATLICTALLLSACDDASREVSDSPSATEELQTLADNVVAQPLLVAPTGLNSNQVISMSYGVEDVGLDTNADVYLGTLDLPYYFDPSNSTVSSWGASLAVRETLTVPVMMTLPNEDSGHEMPDSGWPIVMFQHGITRNRTDVLAYSIAQATAGFAVIAIDLPTHGLTDETNAFHADNATFAAYGFNETEQTFDVDSRTQDSDGNTTALTPDGIVDSSGTHFINITSLKTSRDNLRQGAANLLTLRKSLGGMIDVSTGNSVLIDTDRVGLIAHSLGGMAATLYLGVENTPTPSSIVMAGATITDVLINSESFAPVVLGGLAVLGVTSEEDITEFFVNAQETIDAGEPANYAAKAAATHPIHLIEVIGDTVVPNSTTENLATIMGATSISTNGLTFLAVGTPGIVRYISGEHSSVASPDSSADGVDDIFSSVTTAMQTELATFQAYSGTAILISAPDLVQ